LETSRTANIYYLNFIKNQKTWIQYEFWAKNDIKNMLKKIAALFLAICDDPFNGIGKPEPLKAQLKGYWSRRIDHEHRIVYTKKQFCNNNIL
jgi:toxin YoeB